MLKKYVRKCFVLFLLCLVMGSVLCIHAQAATTLTISQPENWEHISKGDAPDLKWNAVTGAAGYRVTVKDYETGELYTQNEWTTSRSYALADLFADTMDEDNYPTLKIWVGAMQESTGSVTIAEDFIYVIAAEVPDVTRGSAEDITADSVTLYMSVDRDYGSAITDSGFYLGTSSTVSKMTQYSFQDYGSFSATAKGEKYLQITGLEPDTKYYYRAYAVNGVGEETTSSQTFYTEAETAAGMQLSASAYAPAWNSTTSKSITVSGVSSISYSVAYSGISEADMAVYDYAWLDVTQSGTTLTLTPNRPNYYGSARTATVTVTGGGESKTVTVIQAACGEADPTVTARVGTKTFVNGANAGDFLNGGEAVFDLSVDVSAVRKVTVNLWKSGDSKELEKMDIITDNTDQTLDCNIPILSTYTAGIYYVDIYASNSNVANDYWAKRPDSIRIYFTIVSDTADEKLNFDHITGTEAERIVQIAEALVKTEKEDLHFAEEFGLDKDPGDWCAAFVSLCAQKAGLSELYIMELRTEVGQQTIDARRNANPASLLRSEKARVYYFYDSYENNKVEWTSENVAPGKTYEFFMTDLNPTEDLNRTLCVPQPGDLLFFKKASNNAAWAHVGLVTKVNNSTGYMEFVDGNNYLNGNMLEGYKSTEYVNKKYYNNWKDDWRIMAIAHPFYDGETEIDSNPQGPTVIESFTVEYDANGGSGAPETQSAKKGTSITLSTQKPTRSGYTFQGWATSAAATTAAYQPGDQYTVTGKLNLYAVWKKNSSSGQNTVQITQQPKSVTVAEGETAKVTVKATGDGLTYRWYYKNAGDSSYTYTSSFTGNTYSVTMNASRDGRRVVCRVYDKYGNSVQSDSVLLSMEHPVKITSQPVSVTVAEGETAKVTVKATGDGLTYRWYYKNAGASAYTYTSSFTGNTYSVTMNASRDGRRVVCRVYDKYGNVVQSDSALLSMEHPVQITQQPKSVTVAEGETAKVTVKATGDGLTYRWYYKNAGASSYTYTSSFKSNTYSVTMNASRDGRRVLCKVYDQYGNMVQSSSALLKMK